MRISGRLRLPIALLLATAAAVVSAPAASAQTPEVFPLGQGSLPSLASTWQANALQPNTVLSGLSEAEAILDQTYATILERGSERAVGGGGERPLGLPTVEALVGGAAGKRVKTVKIFFAGAPMQKLATIKPPAH